MLSKAFHQGLRQVADHFESANIVFETFSLKNM